MNADNARDSSERDQLWASLRALKPHILRLANGEWEDSETQRQLVVLLARIVSAEMDYRARDAAD